MPRYRVTIDGKSYVLTGDHAPTEAEAREAISARTQPEAPGETAPPPTEPEGKSFGGLLSNAISDVPEAVINIGKGAIDTARFFGKGMQALSGDQGATQDIVQGGKSLVSGLLTKAKDAYADPRGTASGLLESAYQHPVQAALMTAPLPGGGPLTRGAGLVTRAARGKVRAGGQRLMQSALKPSESLVNARTGAGFGSKEDIAQAVLDEGRSVTRGGLEKAQSALDATDAEALQRLRAGAGQGVTVDPFKVTAAIDARSTGQFGRQINAQPDTAAIRQVHENFAANPHVSDPVTGMAPMPADLAHEFATNTGRNLRGKFGRLGGATVEAEKAGREAITSQLRNQIPELGDLWKAEARQITVRDAIDDALERQGNRDPAGLGTIVGAVRSPGLALTAAADRSGALKSLLARALANGIAPNMTVTPEMVRAALAGLLVSHSQE